ncbi:MAG: BREX-1 system adenine-specific DNA-methyltransferase PglX, partial [Lachnospiraceae bacterium]
MNKNAIKKFAIEARKKLIDSVTDKAGMLGITEKLCSEPITKGVDFEVYQTVAGTEVTLNKRQCEQRRRLVSQINSRGFETVVEEVAYTWFNRICAIRFMEVNDYLPNRVRVLSSEKEGKMEPDLVTQAPDVDLDLTAQDKEEIINWKLSGASEDTDKLYCKLFLKQCHQLHDILPGLFEADSDYMELLFGISYTNKDDVIYMLVNPDTGIPENDFNVSAVDEEGNPTGQVEIIGWLYQYYNTELKDDTFAKLKKNIKITKERIPAATQLFTPDWIVRYMVENSVGRIWIEHLRALDPTIDEKKTAERFGWKYYLPEAEQEESVNVKLAEIRSNYKDLKPTDITCIDPCMGSGHILIAMFDVLMDIYESAGYDKREAAFEIVEHNIHGLDIDRRAYQLAYFAVMMKGRGYNRRFLRGRDGKPEPKVYAIAESNEINRNHLKFFGTHLSEMERNLAVMQVEGLLDTFVDAREYGSILNVDACDWDVLERFVEDFGTDGQISFESVGSEETQESLRKLVRVAKNLGQKYDAVVTNPPYMGASGMGAKLSKYVKDNYSDSKSDLFAVFIEKCGQMAKKNAYQAMITQHAWMFLSSFEKLRNKLQMMDIVNMAHLGPRAFEEIGGEVVQTTSFVLRKSHVEKFKGTYCRLIEPTTQQGKEKMFLDTENRYCAEQDNFSKIPGSPVAYWVSSSIINLFTNSNKLGELYDARSGLQTNDNSRFLRYWYEIDINKSSIFQVAFGKKWFPHLKGGPYRRWYGNLEYVVNWENNGFEILELATKLYGSPTRTAKSIDKYFLPGFTWSDVSTGLFSVRATEEGYIFDTTAPTISNKNNHILPDELLGFLNSKVAQVLLSLLAPTIHYNCGAIALLPIIEIKNEKIREMVKKSVALAKRDWDNYEISWNFTQHPLLSIIPRHRMLFDDITKIDLAECY